MALQVADRRHLLCNLSSTITKSTLDRNGWRGSKAGELVKRNSIDKRRVQRV